MDIKNIDIKKINELIKNADTRLAEIGKELKQLKQQYEKLDEERYYLAGKRMKLVNLVDILEDCEKVDFEEFE